MDAQNQLREEILGKLEETNRSIDQVGILKQNICEDCECFDTFVCPQVSGDLVNGLDGVTSELKEK